MSERQPLSLFVSRRSQMFPTLNAPQIATARRFASAPPRDFAPGKILVNAGDRGSPAFLVLSGEVAISGGPGTAAMITTHVAGEITGEISQLAGRPSLAEARAGAAGCQVLPFDAAHLRALLIGSAELGELLMRAFILRRTALITEGGAGTVFVGHPGVPAVTRLEGVPDPQRSALQDG